MRRLLVLRPEPSASATVERARLRGFDAIAVPLFEIEPIAWTAPEAARFDALLITSANALRCGGEELQSLRGLPVYAVGEATAEAVRRAGFDIAATGDSGIDRLLASIAPDLKLLHLCGEDRRSAADAAQRITPLAVYRARPRAAPQLTDLQGCVALIHSPRAGQRFAELVKDRESIAIIAISAAAADAVGRGWQSVAAAERPDEDALLALAERLCNNLPR
jgi:uroporphyrinogen-III synthase